MYSPTLVFSQVTDPEQLWVGTREPAVNSLKRLSLPV
jgi:hypothetical protein